MVVLMAVALGAAEGGFYPTAWMPATLFALALLGVTTVIVGMPARVPRATLVALGLFAGYTAWTYASIGWADQQGLAWDGANRTALYLLVLALFALWPIGTRAGALLLGVLGLGIAAMGVVELLRAAGSAYPESFMVDARLAQPVGYINANVAFWALGTWPCLLLASRRETAPLLRGAFLASAGLLSSLALLGQSRSWLVAIPLAAIVYLALVPNRLRAAAAMLGVATGTAAISGHLLAVHDQVSDDRTLVALLDAATWRILAVAAVLGAVGVVWGLVDRRVRLSAARERAAGRAAAAITAAAVAATIVLALATGAPGALSDRWQEFKQGGAAPYAGSGRLSSAQTNRYDFWVVSMDLFKESPLRGIGAENFQAEYLKRGNSGEQPRYPHSLEMSVLAQTGIVGLLLLGGALAAALVSAFQAREQWRPLTSAIRAGAVTTFAYFALHASVDWLWEFPALGVAAFAMLGMAMSLGRRQRTARRPGAIAALALTAPALLLAASVAFPWFAVLETRQANVTWRTDPAAAIDRLDRASQLNPLSPAPALTSGTIALEIDDLPLASEKFRQALSRDHESFYAVLELGAIAVEQKRYHRGETLLRRAEKLSPLNDIATNAIRQLKLGYPVPLDDLNRDILDRARQRAQ